MVSASLYVYAITPAAPTAPRRPGLQDAALFAVEARRVAAVVSAFAGPPPRPDADSAWRHESVVEDLCRDQAALPLRFGTLAGSELEVQSLLREREEEFVHALEKVCGHVELGLRVLSLPAGDALAATASGPATAPPSGRAYLLGRQADEQRVRMLRDAAREHAQSVCRHLAGLAADSAVQVLPSRGLVLSAAFLVDQTRVEEFVAAVRQLESSQESLRFLCTGPWPPYSFVGHAADGGLAELLTQGTQADRSSGRRT